jgi:dihydroxyacetone kinase-like predicted kinase
MTAESGDLRRWLASGAKAVKRARARLDAINVFPVADSDTGTNMYLTLQEGNRAVALLKPDASHREVSAAFARGALLGARGNSGVIVSQYLSAFLEALDSEGGLSDVQADGIARALTAASAAAYEAVGTPVEGTILTVAAQAAHGAADAAAAGKDRAGSIVAAVEAARTALAATTSQLPQAKQAGVVDAGAAGLVLQLEMLAETIAGPDALDGLAQTEWELASTGKDVQAVAVVHHDHNGTGGRYEVMFVAGDEIGSHDRHARDSHSAEAWGDLSAQLARIGDSVAVTGARGMVQAHVHTNSPDAAVEIAAVLNASQILVRNILASRDRPHEALGLVAMTQCPGLAASLADAGAVVLVAPHPSEIKSRELKRAVRDASGTSALVVTGDPALRAAAQALAARKKGPTLLVIDTHHEAHVVAAVAAACVVGPSQNVPSAMTAAVAATEVATSTADALDEDVDRLLDASTEMVTLILPEGMSPSVADAVILSAAARSPRAEVAVYQGRHGSPVIFVGVERSR